MKNIAILGSTGSIGTQTLDVVDKLDLKVSALTAANNITLLEQQVRKYKPALAVVFNEEKAKELQIAVADTATKVRSGMDGLVEAAQLPQADLVLNSVVGMVGLQPTIAAAQAKTTSGSCRWTASTRRSFSACRACPTKRCSKS